MAPDGVTLSETSTIQSGSEPVPAVSRLTLTDFRGYAQLDLALTRAMVVLTGPNGAGKTNLLEAVSLLAPGRGLRRASLAEIQREGSPAPGWAVAATLRTSVGPLSIGTGRTAEAPERRVVKIDGQMQRSQTALAPLVAVAWLTPQMDRIFLEGALGRRRFLDRLVYGIDPAQAERLATYEHAMRERARLLREGRFDRAWLGALEETMAAQGVAIAVARVALVTSLQARAEIELPPFPIPDLAMIGEVETALATDPALTVEDGLRTKLEANRRLDADSGTTLIGPHRSDFAVRHRAKSMPAAQCSTGEQKALLVATQLAHANLVATMRGEPPLLLLDEVAAHLDGARLDALFQALRGLGGQIWLTGTERDTFRTLSDTAQMLTVRDGRVDTLS